MKPYVNSIKVGNSSVIIRQVREKPKDQDEEVVNFKGHISTSKYAFIGYDKKRNYHRLSQDWIDMNYKEKFPKAYKRIMRLRPGENYRIPAGSTNEAFQNYDEQTEYSKKDISLIGPMIRYVQGDRPSCLAYSITSDLVYINQGLYATRIMEYYGFMLNDHDSEPFMMCNVLDIIFLHKERSKGEKRFKTTVNKVKQPDTIKILNDKTPNTMYHCILSNTHAIVLIDEWIFDSTQDRAIPRNELHL